MPKPTELSRAFSRIKRNFTALQTLSVHHQNDDTYYTNYFIFRNELREFLSNHRYIDLSKPSLLLLIKIVSSIRPIEPFRFIGDIASQFDDANYEVVDSVK